MRYVVHRRFNKRCLCGCVNLPYGTVCELDGETIEYKDKTLVFATSEDAHQFFARDDDGRGLERGKLTQDIISSLRTVEIAAGASPTPKQEKQQRLRDEAWERIWGDEKLHKFRVREFENDWVWNHAFFNAEIEELQYIKKVISGGNYV